MASDGVGRSRAGLSGIWRPHPSIEGDGERRRARVAMALLASLAALGVLDLIALLSGLYGEPQADSWIEFGTIVALVLAYFLARTGRVTAGVLAAVVAVTVTLLHLRSQAPPGPGEVTMLYFLVIPILLAGLLLPARVASAVALGITLLAVTNEAYQDVAAGLRLDVEDWGLLLLLVAIGLLSVIAAALNDRDIRMVQSNQQLLRQITENIPEVLFLVSADGKTNLYTSPAYERVTGRTVAQARDDVFDWLKAVHPEDLGAVQANLANGKTDFQYRIAHPSGAVKHLRARTFPVMDGRGRLESIVGMAEDITATVQAQQQLREAQRQRIKLMQQLAHDMASPLTPVKLQLRLLKDKMGEDGARGLDVIRRNTDHLERLVADVRDVARLEGGDLNIFRKPVDVADLARQAVESLSPGAAERQVRLVVDAPRPAPVQGDAGRITQVLYNLVGNAMKFTPPGGQVTVAVTTDAKEAVAAVRDTGSGMTPEQLSRLFKPFSQVHDPAAIKRAEDKGSGLGLYISKGLVEAHGGTINVASDGPGTGSTFTFRLPLASNVAP